MIQNVYNIDRAYASHVSIMVLEHFHQYLMCEAYTKSEIDMHIISLWSWSMFINILITDDERITLIKYVGPYTSHVFISAYHGPGACSSIPDL